MNEDKGQRWEISYFDANKGRRVVYGWVEDIKVANKIMDSIEERSSSSDAKVFDRQSVLGWKGK